LDATPPSALSGVLGSLVGGTATAATAWISQKANCTRELLREEMRIREALYGEFVAESAKLLMDALAHTLDRPDTLLPAYALINPIRQSRPSRNQTGARAFDSAGTPALYEQGEIPLVYPPRTNKGARPLVYPPKPAPAHSLRQNGHACALK